MKDETTTPPHAKPALQDFMRWATTKPSPSAGESYTPIEKADDPVEDGPRQLLLTPFVRAFLEKVGNAEANLHHWIRDAMSGTGTFEKGSHISGDGFHVALLKPTSPGKPKRVLVYHSSSDNAEHHNPAVGWFLTSVESILARATPHPAPWKI